MPSSHCTGFALHSAKDQMTDEQPKEKHHEKCRQDELNANRTSSSKEQRHLNARTTRILSPSAGQTSIFARQQRLARTDLNTL